MVYKAVDHTIQIEREVLVDLYDGGLMLLSNMLLLQLLLLIILRRAVLVPLATALLRILTL